MPPPSATTTNPATEEPDKTVQLQAAATAKNVPVNFWGKVVDQDEQPLSGVRVVMRVRQWFYNPNSGPGTLSPKQERTTDAEGRFEWTGASGDSLELESVTKEGYRLSPKAQSGFIYRRDGDSFQPVAANPVVIRMWKLTASEALVSFRTLFGFVPDGRGYTMDLLTNKKLDGEKPEGDLVVRMTRPATVEPRQKYDWTLELDGVNGGLVEPADEFGYVAPEAGYQSKVSIRLRASDTDWVDSLTRDFFIRSRGGALYGLLHLSIRSEYDGKSAILFETRLNPQGSRNLQP
ncbi:MAG: hypothetical protein WCK27_16390 [Verrucomicrobiota bacterium]